MVDQKSCRCWPRCFAGASVSGAEDHHQQERRKHSDHRGHSRRLRCGHRAAPVEVHQQPCRAGPPGHQAHRATNARVLVLSLREHPPCRHRDDAHDQEGTARPSQCPSFDRSIPVLLAGILIIGRSPGFAEPHAAIATEPPIFVRLAGQRNDRRRGWRQWLAAEPDVAAGHPWPSGRFVRSAARCGTVSNGATGRRGCVPVLRSRKSFLQEACRGSRRHLFREIALGSGRPSQCGGSSFKMADELLPWHRMLLRGVAPCRFFPCAARLPSDATKHARYEERQRSWLGYRRGRCEVACTGA